MLSAAGPAGSVFQRRWCHRYCSGASRTAASSAAASDAVSSHSRCPGSFPAGGVGIRRSRTW